MLQIGRCVLHVCRHQHAVHAVALREADPDMLAVVVFVVAPALHAALRAGADADHVDRAVRRIVVGVAEEILRRELPVRREDPFVHADHLRPAGPPVAAVQHLVQMVDRVAQVAHEVRAPADPRMPTPCLCRSPASAPRSATSPRGPACPRTARDTAARPAACRRWCSSRNDTGRQTTRCCPAHSGIPSSRDAGRNSGTHAPRRRGRGTGSLTPRPSAKRRNRPAWGSGFRARRTARRG